MYRPTIYRNGLFDDLFSFSFPAVLTGSDKTERKGLMKTDIRETEKNFEMAMELPGYSKDQIEITLEDGNLTVRVSNKEEKETCEAGFIRKERYTGEAERTFFVGKELTEKDVHARFENGVLYLDIPRETEKEETRKLISID